MTPSFDGIAAARAAERQAWARYLDKDDHMGAQARGLPVIDAYRDWCFAEAKRCTGKEVTHAELEVLATMIAGSLGTVAFNAGAPPFAILDTLGPILIRMVRDRLAADITTIRAVKQ